MQEKITVFPSDDKSFKEAISTIDVEYIAIDVFKKRLNRKEFARALLLDIREFEELEGPLGCLDGICHIPLEQLMQRVEEIQNHRNNEIIVICRKANRAVVGAQILKYAGFQRVFILEGGMLAYRML